MTAGFTLNLQWAAATDIGSRAENQDYWQAEIGPHQAVFVIADGLGGQMDGTLASLTAGEAAKNAAAELEDASAEVVAKGAIFSAAKQVAALRSARGSDMASTLVVLVLTPTVAAWSWCGDSRLYRLRDGKLDRLTNDHSVSMAQVEPGERWSYDVRGDPGRSLLISVLGQDSPLIEQGACQPKNGDVFLLCTDGFWEHMPRKDMLELCNTETDPTRMLGKVLNLQHSDLDNMTLVRAAVL